MTFSLHGPVIQTCNCVQFAITRAFPVTKPCTPTQLAAITTATVMSLTSAVTMADDTGFYVGANVGRVLSTYRRSELDAGLNQGFGGTADGFTLGPSSVDKDHVMWSADIGYMLSRYYGVEASYLYLGSLKYSAFGTQASFSGDSEVAFNTDFKTHGPAVAVLGVLPMSNLWEVDARIGAYAGTTVSRYNSAVGTNTLSGKVSKHSTSLLVGFGTGFTLTSHCTVRLDYLRLEHVDEKVFDRSFNVDLVTVGAAYVF
jgi:OOP family OmpA-OmpF porin